MSATRKYRRERERERERERDEKGEKTEDRRQNVGE
jgi:hypothetical protein